MKPVSIYVHIPYCLQKCFYCDFNSVVVPGEKDIEVYIEALKRDIGFFGENNEYFVETIYLGGGTPSILSGLYIQSILDEIRLNFKTAFDAEVTIEANPATLTCDLLDLYKQAGVNRISLGVQSFQDEHLKQLGRVHDSQQAKQTIILIRDAGVDNISIDLMCGLANQTIKQWEEDLTSFVSLGLEHVSFYDLTIEPGTPFGDRKAEIILPGEDIQVEMYTLGCRMLESAGYNHYEISSFSKPLRESRHNCRYWRNEEYIGFGAGSFSYLGGKRFSKSRDIAKYVFESYAGKISQHNIETLNPELKSRETVVLNLRMAEGAVGNNDINPELDDLTLQGLLVKEKNRYKLTEKGILLYDTVASTLVGEG